MGAWVIVGFGAYLRPSENMSIKREDLVRPEPGMSQYWSMLIYPEERPERSKTGTKDNALLWDVRELEWFSKVFEVLKEGPPGPIWPFRYDELTREFNAVCKELGLTKVVPYQLRHSGPSGDRLKRWRTNTEIQKRGRWAQESSVARYEKHARVTLEMQKLPQVVADYCRQCDTHLEEYFHGLPVPGAPQL